MAALADVARSLDATGVALDRSAPVTSRDRTAALVSFSLADPDDVDATLAAVATVQKAYPTLTIAQAGEASGDKFIPTSSTATSKRRTPAGHACSTSS